MSEREILDMLQSGGVQFPPLCLSALNTEQILSNRVRFDAFLRMTWEGHSHDFAVECKALSTPQAFRDAVSQIQYYVHTINTSVIAKAAQSPFEKPVYPMILVPYLSDEQLHELEGLAISGLDLCGNGIIIVPGAWLIFRTGFPNKFPHTTPIKNVYTGVSSLVARTFLLQPKYTSVGAIKQEIERRGRYFEMIKYLLKQYDQETSLNGFEIAFSTVSKALKNLEEDLIIERENGVIRLIQPEKLLEKLAQNYKPPKITRRFTGKLPQDRGTALTTLLKNTEEDKPAPILTGSGSAGFYSTGAREEQYSFYCTNIARTLENTDIEETTRFADIELLETEEPTVYLDRRNFNRGTGILYVASPIQTYLELMQGDARDKQAAKKVWLEILEEMEQQNQ